MCNKAGVEVYRMELGVELRKHFLKIFERNSSRNPQKVRAP